MITETYTGCADPGKAKHTRLRDLSVLQQISLFASLSPDQFPELANSLNVVELPAEVILFHEGDYGDCFYVILEGQLEIVLSMGTGDERSLGERGSGDFLGETSMFDRDGLRTATVRSTTPVLLLEMTHGEFDNLLHRLPDLAYQVIRELSLRIRNTDNAAIHDLRAKNVQLAQAYEELKAAQAEIIEKERLERELQVAAKIQESMLPHLLPTLPGFNFGAHMIPARAVGGDLFDFIPLGEDKLGIVIGDVSDKGVPAALFMAMARSLLRAEASRYLTPADVLTNVNRHLLDMNDAGMFITVIYGVLDCKRNEFYYGRAGHEVPLLFDAQGMLTRLGHHQGQMLGILAEAKLDIQIVSIPPGGSLFLYTDGATDVENQAGERFGYERLAQAVGVNLCGSAQELCDRVLEAIQDHQGAAHQADDVTMVAVCSNLA